MVVLQIAIGESLPMRHLSWRPASIGLEIVVQRFRLRNLDALVQILKRGAGSQGRCGALNAHQVKTVVLSRFLSQSIDRSVMTSSE